MNQELLLLVNLQELDFKVLELERSKEEFPTEVERLERAIAESQEKSDTIQGKLDEARSEKQKANDEIGAAKSMLERSQERLNAITTNREYDAVHTEIESNKHILANGENRLYKLNNNISTLEDALQEAQEQLEQVRSENQPKIDELKSRIETIDSEIETWDTQRKELIPSIPKHFLRPYEHIHQRRKTQPALSLVTEDSKTCSVCHKVLEIQLYNEVKRAVKLVGCQSCGSLLIFDDRPVEEEPAAEE